MKPVIKPSHITADFYFQDVVCPIGKFDLDVYDGTDATVSNLSEWAVWTDPFIQGPLLTQLENSGLFTDDQMETINYMDPMDLRQMIVDR